MRKLEDQNDRFRSSGTELSFEWPVRLTAGWCWFVLREKHCWLIASGWFVLREKYCWLVADKPNEQGDSLGTVKYLTIHSHAACLQISLTIKNS
jgi:hypothetical protein